MVTPNSYFSVGRRRIGMKIAVCPGSFDPITYGHLDIIERAAQMFDRVIVAVAVNPGKKHLFSMEERIAMIEESCKPFSNVSVGSFTGLLSDYVRQEQAQVIVRGLRAVSDFEIEFQMAIMNKRLYPGADTCFLMTRPRYSYLSSSLVKEIAGLGGNVGDFVPEGVVRKLSEKMNRPT
jgi:pantetheine-phosphate adenylyltransferase